MSIAATLPHVVSSIGVNMGGNIIFAVLAAGLVQWAKTSPKFPWLTPEMNAGVQALVVILSIFAGLLNAANNPEAFSAFNWQDALSTVWVNAAIVWLAMVNFYQHVLKPHTEKAAEVKEATPTVQ